MEIKNIGEKNAIELSDKLAEMTNHYKKCENVDAIAISYYKAGIKTIIEYLLLCNDEEALNFIKIMPETERELKVGNVIIRIRGAFQWHFKRFPNDGEEYNNAQILRDSFVVFDRYGKFDAIQENIKNDGFIKPKDSLITFEPPLVLKKIKC